MRQQMDDGLRPKELYVTWPALVRLDRRDEGLTLYNPGHGTSLHVEEESRSLVEAVLAGFANGTTLQAFQRAHREVPRELLALMVRSGIVVEQGELPFLEHGFLRPTPHPVGTALSWSDLPDAALEGAWVTVGVPVDFAAGGNGGARQGPAEIRKVVNGSLLTGEGDVVDYELSRLYTNFAPLLVDLGDIEPDGARLDHIGARLSKVVSEVLLRGMRPLVLGGDHSITHFVLGQLIARGEQFGILHFDAHADMGPSRTLSHANVFSEAIASPCVERIVQIGLRGIERMTPFSHRVPCPKRSIITARQAMEGRAQEVLTSLPKDIPYYLSFDIDCIDGAVARETGTPLFAGLSVSMATDLVDYAARNLRLVGADFMEVSGPASVMNASATIAAGLLARCVLADFSFEPLGADIYVV